MILLDGRFVHAVGMIAAPPATSMPPVSACADLQGLAAGCIDRLAVLKTIAN